MGNVFGRPRRERRYDLNKGVNPATCLPEPKSMRRNFSEVIMADDDVRNRLEEYKSLRILLVGRSVAGKSSLVNAMFDDPKEAVVGTMRAETEKVIEHDLVLNDVLITIFDSPGFLAGERKKNEQYIKEIKKKVQHADVILLCLRMDCSSKEMVEPIEILARSFDRESNFWEKTMIVFTMANKVIPAGKHRGEYNVESYNDHIFKEFMQDAKKILKAKKITVEDNQFTRAGNPDGALQEVEGAFKFDDANKWVPHFLIECFKSECWSIEAKAALLRTRWTKARRITNAALGGSAAVVLEGTGIALVVVGSGASVAGPLAWPASISMIVIGGVLCAIGVASSIAPPAAELVHLINNYDKDLVAKNEHEQSKRIQSDAADQEQEMNELTINN